MFKFSKKSLDRLSTCHKLLQDVMNEAILQYDFSVLCGHRNEQDQNNAYEQGYSKVKFPNSRHNSIPSVAVDIAPYPLDWLDIQRFIDLSQIIKRIAFEKNINIEWGGDWKWKDYPHWELVLKD